MKNPYVDDQVTVKVPAPMPQMQTPVQHERSKRTFLQFIKKYLWEGQALSEDYENQLVNMPHDAPWHKKFFVKYRRIIGMVIPAFVFHLLWWAYFIKFNTWYLFEEHYGISIMMIFGSMIAGMTSEGGGSVAFPVMTLAFKISPVVARDFSLLIQSCGMTAAAFTIIWMKVHLEWRSLLYCSIGGVFGSIITYEVIDKELSPAHKKMGFVSLFFAFAFALFLLNRIHKRKTFKSIPEFNVWKAIILVVTGFLGGIFTGIAGSGIDICSFSLLTLLFRVSEKTATPTSIVLMAINTVFGSYWRLVMMNEIQPVTWEYLGVCIPIVVIGAPLGSVIGTHFHRQTLAALNYITDTTALISGFAIVKMDAVTIGLSVGIIAFGFIFYGAITYLGGLMMDSVTRKQEYKKQMKTWRNNKLIKMSEITCN
ncbi:uncharacterized protein LOC130647788 [Hydractinia symbiolongicarpus]|uniref:uncharacterized protein LOC130647788 n=1 Tax=Hydractinia symbiolongicarpus TaxID=13093 RepID=UPI00254B6298|nr:uncharacterized protein LOC130647788 [Hydractinia symbiolongicarpus]XP_057309741.1 uncharacterized protein LOC130647788 [Hydractinia symbiolongicarpus]